ncbi:MAG: hypothetical protein K2V38_03620, partial [Gemmataceae bacterium]|nr:hypothetical protein [Gemmataceae bacterium]
MPTITYFDTNAEGGALGGWVSYQDAQVDAANPNQQVPLTDFGVAFDGVLYSVSDALPGWSGTVSFSAGRVVGFNFLSPRQT